MPQRAGLKNTHHSIDARQKRDEFFFESLMLARRLSPIENRAIAKTGQYHRFYLNQ